MTRTKTLSIAVLAGLANLLAGPVASALAAKSDTPGALKPESPWLAYACAAVALGGVCFIAFRKPKRSKGD